MNAPKFSYSALSNWEKFIGLVLQLCSWASRHKLELWDKKITWEVVNIDKIVFTLQTIERFFFLNHLFC